MTVKSIVNLAFLISLVLAMLIALAHSPVNLASERPSQSSLFHREQLAAHSQKHTLETSELNNLKEKTAPFLPKSSLAQSHRFVKRTHANDL